METPFQPSRKAHPALVVADLERARSRLEAAGVPMEEDPAGLPVRRCFVSDPFGNRIELVDARRRRLHRGPAAMSAGPAAPAESALVVEVPEAAGEVEARPTGPRLRGRARRAGARDHPLPVRAARVALTPDVLGAVAAIAAAGSPFDVRFERVMAFSTAVYLDPVPAEPFRALTEDVTRRFPEHPPYEGQHDVVIPHLTLAFGEPDEVASLVGPDLGSTCAVAADRLEGRVAIAPRLRRPPVGSARSLAARRGDDLVDVLGEQGGGVRTERRLALQRPQPVDPVDGARVGRPDRRGALLEGADRVDEVERSRRPIGGLEHLGARARS